MDPWLVENVLPSLSGPQKTLTEIRNDLEQFIVGNRPRLYAWYADYDWVVFCSIYGRMVDLPGRYRRYCYDLKQLADDLGNPALPRQADGEHNALADAKHNLVRHEALKAIKTGQG